MTKEHTTADLIAQARKWERGYGEGYWFNAMADEIERLDADAAGAQAELASVKACWAEALGNVATRNREIEQLRRERHQLRNELTAARLENQQRRALLVEVYNHGENSELHGRIGAALGAAPGEDASPVEPESSRTVDEIDAPFARRINAEFRRYSAMPPIEFVDLAYDTLSDAAGTEHTTMIHELCARACPEWARDLSETAKVDPPANAPQCPLPVACGRCGGVLGHEVWCNGLSQKSKCAHPQVDHGGCLAQTCPDCGELV